MNPRYPVYIPSKGRWESRLTSKALDKIGVPYHLVIEREEYEQYASEVPAEKLLVLPFSGQGLIASRCWIMKHSIEQGAQRHWQIDDNIRDFYRLHKNVKYRVSSGTIFAAAEDFVDRFQNVAYAGFQYEMFAPRKKKHPPYILNTRIYSCTMVNNEIPYRWRSIYNDDTDVCLMALKDGWCTVLFNAFLADKMQTMTVRGGNTESLYLIQNGRLKMAQALQKLHPDVVKVVWKWNRWQHSVDYSSFRKNVLRYKDGCKLEKGINNYGMVLTNAPTD